MEPSLRTALASTVLCVLFGTPTALVLARGAFRGHNLLQSFVLLPLVLPPVVGGIALLHSFGRRGLLGSTPECLAILIAFSTTAVVLAQTFVDIPFFDPEPGMGATHLRATLRSRRRYPRRPAHHRSATCDHPAGAARVDLRGGVVIHPDVGEFGATLTLAGSLQGATGTLPLEIYLQRDADAAAALSLVLVAVAVVATRTRQAEGTQ